MNMIRNDPATNAKSQLTSASQSIGDAAVDGLFFGLVAGMLMGLILTIFGLVTGESPAAMLTRFDASGQTSPWTGALLHLAVSAIYGILFALVWKIARPLLARLPLLIGGLSYGIVLFIVAEVLLLPGTQSPLLGIPVWLFGLGHIVYGLTLGWLMHRRSGNQTR